MTYSEARQVTSGSRVIFGGSITEVLKIEQRSPNAPYFRLAGVREPVYYALAMPLPQAWRASVSA